MDWAERSADPGSNGSSHGESRRGACEAAAAAGPPSAGHPAPLTIWRADPSDVQLCCECHGLAGGDAVMIAVRAGEEGGGESEGGGQSEGGDEGQSSGQGGVRRAVSGSCEIVHADDASHGDTRGAASSSSNSRGNEGASEVSTMMEPGGRASDQAGGDVDTGSMQTSIGTGRVWQVCRGEGDAERRHVLLAVAGEELVVEEDEGAMEGGGEGDGGEGATELRGFGGVEAAVWKLAGSCAAVQLVCVKAWEEGERGETITVEGGKRRNMR